MCDCEGSHDPECWDRAIYFLAGAFNEQSEN